MILEIQHETVLDYTEPVVESISEVRIEPLSDQDQSCCSFFLAIAPVVAPLRFLDGLGNHVHHFNLLAPHRQTRVLAASIVETHPRRFDPIQCGATWPYDQHRLPLEPLAYLQLRGPARATPLLEPLLKEVGAQSGQRAIDLLLAVSRLLFSRFQYEKAVTSAHSPIDDILQHGRGVCQDFAHLMIAVLRSLEIPARYVSGYIHRPHKESESHAWCEAWLPDAGWVGLDPTHDALVDETFVKVAIGRDYTDVAPNRGTYRGAAKQSVSVRVATRALDRLPALDWQERLPPLDVPTILFDEGAAGSEQEYLVQQQQQQ